MTIQIEPWHIAVLALVGAGWFAKKLLDVLLGIDALLKFSTERQTSLVNELRRIGELNSDMTGSLRYIEEQISKGNLRESMDKLSASTGAFASMPAYVQGIQKVCGELVVQIAALQRTVTIFQRAIIQPDPNPRSADTGLLEHNEEAAFKAGELRAFLQEGLSQEEAEQKAQTQTEELFAQRSV